MDGHRILRYPLFKSIDRNICKSWVVNTNNFWADIFVIAWYNVRVVSSSGATVDVALLYECKAIVRGLRSFSDYDYEVQLQQMNKEISCNKVNTICLFADKEYQFVSSSMVKEVFNLNKDILSYVDPIVEKRMILKKRS